jgi:hypothetical protein
VSTDLAYSVLGRAARRFAYAGQILAALSRDRGGEAYDREWPGRAAKTMW